ncbi:hypothetical protein BKA82DRAFT_4352310 [Pisolithus tinctorius]|nr:hypothetical protein BKA82DRAFT_4352310 [Pisolithus tinctorius]
MSKTAIFDISDSEDSVAEPPPQSITAHLHLETSVEVLARTRGKSTSSTSVKLTQCNPFIFTVKDTFDTFIDAVADAADTMPWHLAAEQLRWQFETPANLQLKLVTNEVGYRAMINAVKSRKKDQVIFLYVPRPIPRELPTIEEKKRGRGKSSGAARELDDEPLPDLSIKSQIDSLRNRSANELKELQDKYPVGNHPRFPNKRIYASGGLFWELTPLRLQIWANAIAAKPPTATCDTPPMSNHFTKASAIPASQMPADVPNPILGAWNEDHHSAPGPHGLWHAPGPHPMYPFGSYFPPPPIPYGSYGYYMSNMTSPPAPTPPPPSQSTTIFSSPSSTMTHNVSLSEFCTKYRLSAHTQEKLEKLDYIPGNKVVESLSEADWKDSGLSVLASRSFLAVHRKFCEAIRAGTWE